jgi:hypothetical protein
MMSSVYEIKNVLPSEARNPLLVSSAERDAN